MPLFFYSLDIRIAPENNPNMWSYYNSNLLNFTAILNDDDHFEFLEYRGNRPVNFDFSNKKWGILYPQNSHKINENTPFAIMELSPWRRNCLRAHTYFSGSSYSYDRSCWDDVNFVDTLLANDDKEPLFQMRPSFQDIDSFISFVQKNEASSTGWFCWNFDTDSAVECDVQDMSTFYADQATFEVYFNDALSLPTINVKDTIKYVKGKWLVTDPSGGDWHLRFHDDLCDGHLNGFCEFGTCVQSGSTTSCQCLDGWKNNAENPLLCEEINECEDDVCGNFCRGGAHCLNAPGKLHEPDGYRCRCQWGEKFDSETKQCIPRVFGETKHHSKPFQIYDSFYDSCLRTKFETYYGDSGKSSIDLPALFERVACDDEDYSQFFEYTDEKQLRVFDSDLCIGFTRNASISFNCNELNGGEIFTTYLRGQECRGDRDSDNQWSIITQINGANVEVSESQKLDNFDLNSQMFDMILGKDSCENQFRINYNDGMVFADQNQPEQFNFYLKPINNFENPSDNPGDLLLGEEHLNDEVSHYPVNVSI